MSDVVSNSESPQPGTNTARAILSVFFLQLLALVAILWPAPQPRLAVWAAYALPFALAVCLILAIRFARQGSASAPSLAAWLGVTLICGTATFDMAATLIHSPDLRREGNPVVRVLLDSGHSSRFVLAYGGIAQGLYLSCLCALWLALLRHRPRLLDSVRGERTFFRFLRSATGGAELSWRQWLLPLRWAELPAAYHSLWILAVTLWSGTMDRLYLGLEWFGLVADLRWQVIVGGVASGLGGYFAWLWRASRATLSEPSLSPRSRHW
jgi:hypothetical protein